MSKAADDYGLRARYAVDRVEDVPISENRNGSTDVQLNIIYAHAPSLGSTILYCYTRTLILVKNFKLYENRFNYYNIYYYYYCLV